MQTMIAKLPPRFAKQHNLPFEMEGSVLQRRGRAVQFESDEGKTIWIESAWLRPGALVDKPVETVHKSDEPVMVTEPTEPTPEITNADEKPFIRRKAQIAVRGKNIFVKCHSEMNDLCKSVDNYRWDNKLFAWVYPNSPIVAANLYRALRDHDLTVEEKFNELLRSAVSTKKAQAHKRADELPDVPITHYSAWLHQRQAFWFAKDIPGVMLAMDMGTGKTKVSTDLIVNRENQKVLIMCPKSAIDDVWVKQLPIHAGSELHVVGLSDSNKSVAQKTKIAEKELKMAEAKKLPFVCVINYDSAWRDPFDSWAMAQAWDCVICDESHKIKAPGGKAALFAAKIGPKVKYRIALSGTPMPHSPLDAYAQYRFLDPGVFGTSFTLFKNKYAVVGGYGNHQVVAYQNEEELNHKFYSIAFRVGKEVLDLPPFIHVERRCELKGEAKRIYKSLEDEFVAELRTLGYDPEGEEFWDDLIAGKVTTDNALTRNLRLQQITSGYIMDDEKSIVELDSGKKDLLDDIMEDFTLKEPLVVFANFHHDMDTIRKVTEKQGRRYAELSGRQNDLKVWQNGDAEVLAVQIKTGGAGIDLTRARYGIYYSITYSLGDFEQSQARIHRPGQTQNTTYVHLLAKGTVDEKIYKALAKRKQIIAEIMKEVLQ